MVLLGLIGYKLLHTVQSGSVHDACCFEHVHWRQRCQWLLYQAPLCDGEWHLATAMSQMDGCAWLQ